MEAFEIERKFLVKKLPEDLEKYECRQLEQGYLCTARSCVSDVPTIPTH